MVLGIELPAKCSAAELYSYPIIFIGDFFHNFEYFTQKIQACCFESSRNLLSLYTKTSFYPNIINL
jgi:hypothetical protein